MVNDTLLGLFRLFVVRRHLTVVGGDELLVYPNISESVVAEV